jgi:hypothetical protein
MEIYIYTNTRCIYCILCIHTYKYTYVYSYIYIYIYIYIKNGFHYDILIHLYVYLLYFTPIFLMTIQSLIFVYFYVCIIFMLICYYLKVFDQEESKFWHPGPPACTKLVYNALQWENRMAATPQMPAPNLLWRQKNNWWENKWHVVFPQLPLR